MQEINNNPVQEAVMESLGKNQPSGERRPSGIVRVFDLFSYRVLILLAFAAPLVISFIPGVPFEAGKRFWLVLLGLVSLALWLFARARDSRFSFPGGAIAWTSLGVVGATFAATIGSGAFNTSFSGGGYETGTFLSVFFFFIVSFLSAVSFQNAHRVSSLLHAFFASVVAVFLLEIVHLRWPDKLFSSVLVDATSNLVGKWNDLGIFFGLGLVLSLLSLETYRLRGAFRWLMVAVFGVSLLGLSLVALTPAWIIVGLVSFSVSIYLLLSRREGARRFSVPALLVLLLSLGFVFAGSPEQRVGGAVHSLAGSLGVAVPVDLEVRPSWRGTFEVAQSVLKEDPVLGTGPNRFVNAWFAHRPLDVNQLALWNVDFNFGVGFIPTMLITTGILGIVAWVLFLLTLLLAGIRALFAKNVDPHAYALVFLTWSAALYLWIFEVIYIPNIALTVLTFLFTGAFVGALVNAGAVREIDWSFVRDRRLGFVSTLLLVLCLLTSVWSGYGLIRRYSALSHFSTGISAASAGDIDTAEKEVKHAHSLDPQDVYARALSEVYLARLARIVTSNDPNIEARRNQFQLASGDAITSALAAVDADPSRFVNWIALGNVYQTLVAPGVGGSYEKARESYENALSLFPNSPAVHLNLARLEIAKGDRKKARAEITLALEKKANFTPALFLLSQLEADEGNISAAIAATEQAAILSPQDVGVHFQLGLLQYLKKDYKKAAASLERAVDIVPTYANARYFLGLSYAFLNRRADAINQFKEIQKTNPDNSDVVKIIRNLTDGRSPLDSLVRPEDRDSLPISE